MKVTSEKEMLSRMLNCWDKTCNQKTEKRGWVEAGCLANQYHTGTNMKQNNFAVKSLPWRVVDLSFPLLSSPFCGFALRINEFIRVKHPEKTQAQRKC